MKYWLKRFIIISFIYYFVTIAATLIAVIFHALILQWFINDIEQGLPYLSFFAWLFVLFTIKNYIYSKSKTDRDNNKFSLLKMAIILIIVSIIMIFVVLNMTETSELDMTQRLFMQLPYIWLPLIIKNVLFSVSVIFIVMTGYFLFVYNKEGKKYLNNDSVEEKI
jgi:hypothetical protein